MSCPITSFWKLKRAGYSQGTVTFSEHSKLKMLYWISIAFTLFLGLSRGFGSSSLQCKDEDTMVAHNDVFKYIGCNEGNREVLDCPSGSFFDVRSACCIGGNEIEIGEFCSGRRDGIYGNPWNCSTFISCANEKEHLLPCPQRTVYNPITKKCMWWVKNSCKQIECTE